MSDTDNTAAETGATIVIDSTDHNSSTPLLVNGKVRKRIRHNEETFLDAAELEALRNSNKTFRIVGAAIIPASETTGGASTTGVSDAPPGSSGGRLNVDPFDVDLILAQTIRKITEDMDEFNADQVGDLLAVESARDKPRPTLIEALNKKQASFAA